MTDPRYDIRLAFRAGRIIGEAETPDEAYRVARDLLLAEPASIARDEVMRLVADALFLRQN